ncbi:MAG: calcium/sodium antiporter [Flavobacteriales bacterium]|nr:calcium/sodium antiporter [Flavobacteriales bacterium]
MLVYLLFVIGFVLLIKGADWLIEGAVSIAQRLKVPDLVVGLTVVAFGTSAPEMSVNIIASVNDNNGLAIGNIVGSNIANVLFILGLCAVIRNLTVQRSTVIAEIPFALLAAVMVGYMVNDTLTDVNAVNQISRADGFVLIALFAVFIFYTLRLSKADVGEEVSHVPQMSVLTAVGLFVVGLAGLIVGGQWIVDGAVHIALKLGYSETFIGLTVVSIGTSLPELATSVAAVRRGNTDLAIGNVIGSNIFNIFWVLGLSAVISPVTFNVADNINIYVLIGTHLLLMLALFVGTRHQVNRWQGVVMLLCYAAYVAYLVAGT